MRIRTGLVLAALLAAPLRAAPLGAEEPAPNLATARVVDLTWPFDAKTIYWPNSPSAFELKSLSHGVVPGGWFYSSNSFCTPEHGGTHLDAPIHFAEKGRTADQVPPRQLIAAAAVIDVSRQAAANADYRLSAADVKDWEKRHGAIAPGTIVLLRTGWGRRWPDKKTYLGDDTPGDASHLHFPSYGPDAAELLVAQRRVGATRRGHGLDRSGGLEGLPGPPPRQRRRRPRPREPREPRGAARDGRLGRRAAHEDRGRIRRAAADRRALESALRSALLRARAEDPAYRSMASARRAACATSGWEDFASSA